MNTYGKRALTHWATWLPVRFSMIPEREREEFFTDLGQQASAREKDLTSTLESQQTQDLDELPYLARVGRLNTIRQQAQEMVLAEMILLPPEPSTRPDPEMDTLALLDQWMDSEGMPRDRSHPLWAMQEDETVSTQDFLAAARRWQADLEQQIALQEQQNLH